MPAPSQKPRSPRAFVALVATAAGIGLPISGLANHVFQTDPLTGSRHAWMAVHNGLGILFVTFVIWHVILNRRAFLQHVRGTAGRWHLANRDVIWATAVVAVVLFVAVGHALHGP